MTGNNWTDDELEYRINRAKRNRPYCDCGRPLTVSKCVDCGGYGVNSIQLIVDFLEGRSKGWTPDLLTAVVREAAKVPILEARFKEVSDRLDDLEKRQDPVWLKWINRGLTVFAGLEWLRRLLEFLRVRRRRTS